MKIKKNSYLNERVYRDAGFSSLQADINEVQFWNQNIGKAFFEKLMSKFPHIQASVMNQEFETDYELEITFPDKTDDTICVWLSLFCQKYKDESFLPFYIPCLAEALVRFKESVGQSALCSRVYEQFLLSLLGKLQKLCIRTLIYEIHNLKNQGRLEGDDTKAAYDYFTEHVINQEWRASLFRKYPVLERCIGEVIVRSSKLYAEAVNRLFANKEAIVKGILGGTDFSAVAGIEGDIADSHRGGKSVLRMKLDNGKMIIYKPHSISNECIFQRLVQKLGKECGITMYEMKRLDCNTYGFCQCVEKTGCSNQGEIERYYQRMGLLIFAFYLLGTNDIHSENIIAHGEYPVLVDLENILRGPVKYKAEDIMGNVRLFLHESVLYSGVLPGCKWGQEGGSVNVSGIGGQGGSRLPFKVPRVVNKGTADIQIQYVQPVLPAHDNMPALNDQAAKPGRYTAYILDGFQRVYEWALREKELLENMTEQLKSVESRYLLADTQRYVMCQNSSYHPFLMTDGARRQIYLYTMWYGRDMENEDDRQTVEWEVEDLLWHDVPYFYFKSDESNLYHTENEKIEKYFSQTPYESLIKRIEKLSENDMLQQAELIKMTITLQNYVEKELVNTSCAVCQRDEAAELPEKEEILHMAKETGDTLLECGVNNGNGAIGWYMAGVITDGSVGWMIQPADWYLYSGISGIGFFLHFLYKYSGCKKYREAAGQIDNQLFQYTKRLAASREVNKSTGIYNGEASILYCYLLFYWITKEDIYLHYAKLHGEIVGRCIEKDSNFDLLDGIAGGVHGLLMLYHFTKEKRWEEMAEQAACRLIAMSKANEEGIFWTDEASGPALLGMSHGNAGIMTALAAMYKVCPKKEYKEAFLKAMAYENAHFDEKLGNWRDFRITKDVEEGIKDTVAWCHGAGGILMSRLMIMDTVEGKDKEQAVGDIKRAAARLRQKCIREGMCLCHGSMGNLLMLMEYERYEGSGEKMESRSYIRHICTVLKEKREHLLPQEAFNPGFMSGYAGTGYGLLCIYDEDAANVLRLGI